MVRIALGTSALVFGLAACQSTGSQTNYETWALLKNPFESTSGGGVMIDGYDPVIGDREGRKVCTTDFSVKSPNGPILYSDIVFDAKPVQGGILCTKGEWRMKDGSAKGSTPFEVFIKDGVQRRSP